MPDSDDEVKLVHLADRKPRCEIVDNGDGTWTFTPAPGYREAGRHMQLIKMACFMMSRLA
ncbi:hypothetical protein O9993_21690 [Vibrio lentus]|nr:hypothetical protein [Vibrio lentus]